MKNNIVFITAFLASILFVHFTLDNGFFNSCSVDPAKYELKYTMKNMEKFRLSFSGETTETMDVMSSVQESVQKEIWHLDFKLISRESNGDLLLEFKYGTLSTEIINSGISTNIDYYPLIGKKAGFTLSGKGDVKYFTGFDALPEIDAGNGKKISSKDYIRFIEMIFPSLPDKRVDIGSKWSSRRKAEIEIPGGKNVIETFYDFKIAEETNFEGFKCLKIEAEYTQTLTGNGVNQGFEFTQKGEGKGKEVIYFAFEKGIYLSITGSLKLEAVADAAGMQIPITSDCMYEFKIE